MSSSMHVAKSFPSISFTKVSTLLGASCSGFRAFFCDFWCGRFSVFGFTVSSFHLSTSFWLPPPCLGVPVSSSEEDQGKYGDGARTRKISRKTRQRGRENAAAESGLGYKLHHLAVESDHDAAIVLRVVTPCGTLVPRNDLLPLFVLERCKDRQRVSAQCAFKSPWQHGPSGAKCDTFLWPMYHPLRQRQ
jgi:hypothetical protein